MLDRGGAASVVSIEANARAYLKCLIMKEVMSINRVSFQLGDFVPYLRATNLSFDIGFACGVLYHLLEPVELIHLLAARCQTLFIWTHYYDQAEMTSNPHLAPDFDAAPETKTTEGFQHQRYRRRYAAALNWKGFCGGGAVDSWWLPKNTILDAFAFFGMEVLAAVEEQNPNGPALLLALRKRGG
jgi:hypothetical protein